MKGKISAFYGAEMLGPSGKTVEVIPHNTEVEILQSEGFSVGRAQEWLMVLDGLFLGLVASSQIEADYH